MTIQRPLTLLSTLLILGLISSALADSPPRRRGTFENNRYCGAALGTGHLHWRYYDGQMPALLNQIKSVGGNTIQLSAYIHQTGIDPPEAARLTTDASLVHAIRRIHSAGMHVFLKPVVEVQDDQGDYVWRGRILGTQRWFDKVYTPYIVSMARLAQRESVEVFAVGSELRATITKYGRWLQVIRSVREVYHGNITYIGNHDSYFNVPFWKALDFISISAYFRLVKRETSRILGPHETKLAYTKRARRISWWRRVNGLEHLPVLVAEVGFQSKGGIVNFYRPWAWTDDGATSKAMQKQMYEAFLSVFLQQKWSYGALLWHWEHDQNAGNTYAKSGYTPQNKPAEWVVNRYFKEYCKPVSSS